MHHYYTVHFTGTAWFHHVRPMICVRPNAVTVPQLSYTTCNYQILCNMVLNFSCCPQSSRNVILFWNATHLVNLQFLNSICQQILLSKLLQCNILAEGHVEYDKSNDIMSPKVNPASSHNGPLEHNLQPGKVCWQLVSLLRTKLPYCSILVFCRINKMYANMTHF